MRCINCKVSVDTRFPKHLPTCPESKRKMKVVEATIVGKFRHTLEMNFPCGDKLMVGGDHGEPPTLKRIAQAAQTHRESCRTCV